MKCLHTLLTVSILLLCLSAAGAAPRDIGSRLEPMIDDWLIDNMENAALELQHPVARNAALVLDAPWEGNTSCYFTVFEDDERYRMYYRGSNFDLETKEHEGERVCYAESTDGIHWVKPELGLFEFKGSMANNIVWDGIGNHDFAPFYDRNPDCAPDAKYKAVGRRSDPKGLVPFKSADGIHWELMQEKPVITEGAFDSLNLAFYDVSRGRYVDFHRGFKDGVRDVMTCTSENFLDWTKPAWLKYSGVPPEHLYTNGITAWPGAPHIFVGLPKRFVPARDLKVHPHPGVSDAVLMTSRDGLHFKRWREALIRPGLQKTRWVNRNNMPAWGIVETASHLPGAPDEWSVYTTEGYYAGPCILRRHTIRRHGFVSVSAPAEGGRFTTKPLIFKTASEKGASLYINYSTSAAGSIRCEIRDAENRPLPGHTLDDCDVIYGDHLSRAVTWKGSAETGDLAGAPVRLHFELAGADLYTIQFR
jgi:hypothetical protein